MSEQVCDLCKDRLVRVLAGDMFYIPRVRIYRDGDMFFVEVYLYWNDAHSVTVLKMAVPENGSFVDAPIVGPDAPSSGYRQLSNRQGNGHHVR